MSKLEPLFAIVDCNNFYASCERAFDPKLKSRPVIVLSNNDGCVIARSNEAKALGITMGMPYFMALPIIKDRNVQVRSSNYTLYGDMSNRVMQVLDQFTPEIEYYSIDEAFLNLAGFEHFGIEQYASKIRQTVLSWTSIPVSIGIAPTKTLAKVANLIAKKHTKDGVYSIMDDDKRLKVLAKIDIEDVWGIGRRWSKFLKNNNISSALDFINTRESWIRKNLNILGLKTQAELRGYSCIDLEMLEEPKKSITVSRSFSETVQELEELTEALVRFVSRGGEKLRKSDFAAKQLIVFIRTNPFNREKQPYYSNSAAVSLPYASDYTPELIEYALRALNRIYKPNYEYKKLGVYFTALEPKQEIIHDLFEYRDNTYNTKLMNALDKINQKMGRGTVSYLGAGLNPKWYPKANMCSPQYTTNWKHIPIIK
jgi:DNA polymerase V